MVPVKIKGAFDLLYHVRVEQIKDAENGFAIVSPMYTHLDKNGNKAGILVNRGF